MENLNYVHSPLNYIGGKRKLLSQIIPLFPKNISTFVDLFCGGCNVGINVAAEKVIFNDNLVYLVDMYKTFRENTIEEVVFYIENRIREFELSLTNKDGYLALREEYNSRKNPLDLFVLVAYSFNHQIRFNAAHRYNIPFGKERSSYNENMKNNLLRFLEKIHSKNFVFRCGDFKTFDFESLTAADFVYADPPYLITTGTYNDGKRGFTGWNPNGETMLLKILEGLNDRGVRFALSNVTEHKGKENSILKEWIERNRFFVHELSMSYKNSNYQTSNCDKGRTIEVLITNYIL